MAGRLCLFILEVFFSESNSKIITALIRPWYQMEADLIKAAFFPGSHKATTRSKIKMIWTEKFNIVNTFSASNDNPIKMGFWPDSRVVEKVFKIIRPVAVFIMNSVGKKIRRLLTRMR